MLTLIAQMALFSLFIIGDTKAGVADAEKTLLQSANRGDAQVSLAKALWMDQNQERAFSVFIEALNEIPPAQPSVLLMDEKPYYDAALSLYLNHRPEEAKNFGQKIRDTYLPLVKQHPNWTKLPFLVALADANLSDFEHFFDLFYFAYKNDSTHFLALKTKAILHIKLFERAKTPGDRERQREIILKLLDQAERAYPQDFSLYRLEIAYATPEKKSLVKQHVLNKILALTMIPSRVDTLYFAKLAQESDDVELKNRWFSATKKWYPGSRSLQQLEENGNQNAR